MSGNSAKSSLNLLNLDNDESKGGKKIDATGIFNATKTLGHKEVLGSLNKETNLNLAEEKIEQKIEQRKFLQETVFGNSEPRLGLDDLLEPKVKKEIQRETHQQKLAKQQDNAVKNKNI